MTFYFLVTTLAAVATLSSGISTREFEVIVAKCPPAECPANLVTLRDYQYIEDCKSSVYSCKNGIPVWERCLFDYQIWNEETQRCSDMDWDKYYLYKHPNLCPKNKIRRKFRFAHNDEINAYWECGPGGAKRYDCPKKFVYVQKTRKCEQDIENDFVCPEDWESRDYEYYPDKYFPSLLYWCTEWGPERLPCSPGMRFNQTVHDCTPWSKNQNNVQTSLNNN